MFWKTSCPLHLPREVQPSCDLKDTLEISKTIGSESSESRGDVRCGIKQLSWGRSLESLLELSQASLAYHEKRL